MHSTKVTYNNNINTSTSLDCWLVDMMLGFCGRNLDPTKSGFLLFRIKIKIHLRNPQQPGAPHKQWPFALLPGHLTSCKMANKTNPFFKENEADHQNF